MKPSHHAVVSIGLAAGVWSYLNSPSAAIACVVCGVFIDIDHHLDYWIDQGKFPWRYKDLAEYCPEVNRGKLYLIFHSWELLTLYWMVVYFLRLKGIWLGAAVGVSVHMICDQIVNPFKPLGYFTWYRMKHQFSRRKIFTEDYIKNHV